MLNYAILSKHPEHFKNFTGLTLEEFNTLNQQITQTYKTHEQKRLTRDNRKRAIGAGHPFKQNLTDRLLMMFLYYRLYASSTLIGYLVNLSQTSVLKNIKKLEPQVNQVLPTPHKQTQKLNRHKTIAEIG